VNAKISEEKQSAAFDFALYLSDPGGSFWDVAHPSSFLDPSRLRHTSSLTNNQTIESKAFLEFGWEPRQLSEYNRTFAFTYAFNGSKYQISFVSSNPFVSSSYIAVPTRSPAQSC